MRVEVRALIVNAGRVAVVQESRQGELCLSLPGGRVDRWESIPDALRREVREELGVEVEIGEFVCAFEVVKRYHLQDLNLVFEATLASPADRVGLMFVDPSDSATAVFPPILSRVSVWVAGGDSPQPWHGNIWDDEGRRER